MANGQIRLKRKTNLQGGYADYSGMPGPPSLMRPGEQIRPVEEFAQARSSGIMMPQAPVGPRLAPPTYEAPEPMGWKKALLGIGLAGAAGLSGQGAQTADQFFYGPQRKAEADYARDFGAYTESESSWDQYYARVMQAQNLQYQQGTATETKRSNIADETERLNRPFNVPDYSTLRDRFGNALHEPTESSGRGRTVDERTRIIANETYAEKYDLDVAALTFEQENEAFREYRQYHGLETAIGVLGPDGSYTSEPRSAGYGQDRLQTFFDEQNRPRTGGLPISTTRGPEGIRQEDIERVEARYNNRVNVLEGRLQNALFGGVFPGLKPQPGTPEYDAIIERHDAAIDKLEQQRVTEMEALRAASTDAPGAGDTGTYNPSTGKVRY